MKSTRKKIQGLVRKTRKLRYADAKNKRNSYIVRTFLELLNTVKLYHWKTTTYSHHKATDELYERLNKHIDKFVEVLIGKENRRVKHVEKQLRLIDANDDNDFKSHIYDFRDFLTKIEKGLGKKDGGLISIRDDLLIDINQFLYLMSFDK